MTLHSNHLSIIINPVDKAEVLPTNPSGCARSESSKATVSSKAAKTKRVTRELFDVNDMDGGGAGAGDGGGGGGARGSPARTKGGAAAGDDDGSGGGGGGGEVVDPTKDIPLMTKMYRRMKSVPASERLVAKRSHVHGWGLFVKVTVPRNDMIVEYVGETVRGCVADLRERKYEEQNVGSCYLFRLDRVQVVDATVKGGMARFINHSCEPNAYAKVVHLENGQNKIVFFAMKPLLPGQEVFYDYKFPIEDEKIPCHCGAVNCRRFLN